MPIDSQQVTFASKLTSLVIQNLELILVAGGASFGSLAQAMQQNKPITARQCIGSILHSAIWSVLVFLWLSGSVDDISKRAVISIIAGIGSHSLVDILLTFLDKKWGLNISIHPVKQTMNLEKDSKKELEDSFKETKKMSWFRIVSYICAIIVIVSIYFSFEATDVIYHALNSESDDYLSVPQLQKLKLTLYLQEIVELVLLIFIFYMGILLAKKK